MLGRRRQARVYVEFRHRNVLMRRVLDLAYLEPTRPVAVIGWVKAKGGKMEPGDYVELDDRLLRKAVPLGMYAYAGVIEDPRFPPPPGAASPPAD